MHGNIETLYRELKEKVTPPRLKEISIDIISRFKNKDIFYFIRFARRIGINTFSNNLNRIFAKIIQIYHPDKITLIIKEIDFLYRNNKYEELFRLKDVYLIDLKTITPTVGYEYTNDEYHSYSEDDFGYYEEYVFDGEDVFSDVEYDDASEDSSFPHEHGFAEAVNRLFFGNLGHSLSALDLKNIDGELDLSDYEINDLAGIEHCVNATIVNLSGNNIIKIYQLSALSGLKSLFLSENSIEDITCLSSLTKLQELDISFNNIEDMSVLLELPELRYVNVIHNPLSDRSVIDRLLNKGVIVIY